MEMKYVVPDMAQSFGTLEFAGESEPVFEKDKNNRRVLALRLFLSLSKTGSLSPAPIQEFQKTVPYLARHISFP